MSTPEQQKNEIIIKEYSDEKIEKYKKEVILQNILKKLKEKSSLDIENICEECFKIESIRDEENHCIKFSINLTPKGENILKKAGIISIIEKEKKLLQEKAESEISHWGLTEKYKPNEEGEKQAKEDLKKKQDSLNHPDTNSEQRTSLKREINILENIIKKKFTQSERARKEIISLDKLIDELEQGNDISLSKAQQKGGKEALKEAHKIIKNIEDFIGINTRIKKEPITKPKITPKLKKAEQRTRTRTKLMTSLVLAGSLVGGGFYWKNAKDKNLKTKNNTSERIPEKGISEKVLEFSTKNKAKNLVEVKKLAELFIQENPEIAASNINEIENIIFLKNFKTIIENEASNHDWRKSILTDPLYISVGANPDTLAGSIGNFLRNIPYLKEKPQLLNECGRNIAPQLYQQIRKKMNIKEGRALKGLNFQGNETQYYW